MASSLLHIIGLLIVVAFAAAALPGGIKPCKDDEKLNECVMKTSKSAVQSLLKGDTKFKVPNLSPLKVPKIVIANDAGGNAVVLKLNLTNVNFHGLETAELTKSEMDTKAKKVRWTFVLKPLVILSDYIMDGKFLLIPVKGEGKSNITVVEGQFVYTFEYTIQKRKGVEYMAMKTPELTYNLKGVIVKFDNLFNGDKALGDNVNAVLNENWKEVERQFAPAITKEILSLFNGIIFSITKNLPFNQILIPK